jgi:hypothetical protein
MKITVSGFDPIITDKGRMSCELMLTVVMILVKEHRKENATHFTIKWLIQFEEIIALYAEYHRKRINANCRVADFPVWWPGNKKAPTWRMRVLRDD